MSIWLRLSFVVVFLRDLLFDSKEEAHFASAKFNTRKFTVLLLLLSLISGNSFLINRVYHLAKKIKHLEDVQIACNSPQKDHWEWDIRDLFTDVKQDPYRYNVPKIPYRRSQSPTDPLPGEESFVPVVIVKNKPHSNKGH